MRSGLGSGLVASTRAQVSTGTAAHVRDVTLAPITVGLRHGLVGRALVRVGWIRRVFAADIRRCGRRDIRRSIYLVRAVDRLCFSAIVGGGHIGGRRSGRGGDHRSIQLHLSAHTGQQKHQRDCTRCQGYSAQMASFDGRGFRNAPATSSPLGLVVGDEVEPVLAPVHLSRGIDEARSPGNSPCGRLFGVFA